jgi:glycosyltransferase involved in cell wall biosynthesis
MIDGVKLVRVRSATSYRGNGIARMLNIAEFALRVRWLGRSCFHGELARPDIIVGSSPHLFAAWAAEWLSRRLHARFVFEVRDLWPESLVALGVFGRRHPVVVALRALERHLYRRADAIVSLLPEAWRYIARQRRVPREKITWIPNGASLDQPAVEAASTGEPRPLTVMYLGAHGRANALDDLLTAARMTKEQRLPIRFVLVGDGPEKANLIAGASRLGLDYVTFQDPVPKTEVARTLAGADVLVALLEDTPLYEYGISLNKLFDYMAAGKPIVLAGSVAHNYVEIAQCGFAIPPRDADALARSLADLAAMPDEARREMGARGRAYVKANHSWDLLAERLAVALDEVVVSGRPGKRNL